jgi:hypothetical protein
MQEIPSRRVSRDRALYLAEQFTLIPGFPNRPAALEAIADWLCDHCADAAEAQAITTKAVRTWAGAWSGIWQLEKLLNAAAAPQNRPFTAYPKLETCPRCENTGVIQAESRYARCECEFGRGTPDEFLAQLNKKKPTPVTAIEPAKRITQADFDRLREEKP